jgi:copper resistance protein C
LFKLAILLFTAAAWAHARLERSEPRDGGTLEHCQQVDLWFDSRIEPRFHSLELISGKERRTLSGTLDPSDPRHLQAPLPALSPGAWTLRYEVVSRDGHRVEGEVHFTVILPRPK